MVRKTLHMPIFTRIFHSYIWAAKQLPENHIVGIVLSQGTWPSLRGGALSTHSLYQSLRLMHYNCYARPSGYSSSSLSLADFYFHNAFLLLHENQNPLKQNISISHPSFKTICIFTILVLSSLHPEKDRSAFSCLKTIPYLCPIFIFFLIYPDTLFLLHQGKSLKHCYHYKFSDTKILRIGVTDCKEVLKINDLFKKWRS